MQDPLASAGVYTDISGLARLRAQASKQSPDAHSEVARQFEALLLQTMLKAMREASRFSEAADGEQTRFYQDMFDKQIALALAGKGGIGLAPMIERQLAGQAGKPVSPAQAPVPSAQPATNNTAAQWQPANQEVFIRELWPHAVNGAKELGVSADVLIAQAALETGWGRKMIHDRQGVNAFNLFGIKAGLGWRGEPVNVATVEYRDGIARRENAAFRRYASLEESMNDYVKFLKQNPRYQPALENAGDARTFLHELQRAGYATDPAYAEKISNIMQRESFTRTVTELRLSDDDAGNHSA